MKTKKIVVIATAADIDDLGAIKAQLAELKKVEEMLVARVKAAGLGRIEGDLFESITFEQERETVDWKAIAEKVGYSRQLLTAHTTNSTICITKVQARTGIKEAA